MNLGDSKLVIPKAVRSRSSSLQHQVAMLIIPAFWELDLLLGLNYAPGCPRSGIVTVSAVLGMEALSRPLWLQAWQVPSEMWWHWGRTAHALPGQLPSSAQSTSGTGRGARTAFSSIPSLFPQPWVSWRHTVVSVLVGMAPQGMV